MTDQRRQAAPPQARTGWQAALLCGLLISGCLLAGGCSRSGSANAYRVFEGGTMGTYFRVTSDCEAVALDAVQNTLSAVNAEMSNYDPNSQLSRFNAGPVGQWLPVSAELATLLELAAQVHKRSGGAFDVTVAPVLRAWGFGPGADESRVAPEPAAIARLRARVGQAALRVRSAPSPALLRERAVEVDLSAIAKGHGVDRVAELFSAAGCSNYLVDIGGEVRAAGLSPKGRSWRVGIEVPDPTLIGSIQRVLALDGVAVATSGDYRNFIDRRPDAEGRTRWSHTIDPRTGAPVAHQLASVTVAAASAAAADGWATALTVLGPSAGWALAQELDLAVLFITRTATGFEERYTQDFDRYLLPTAGT
ncbi:MAG: FAD:protein FMN transferase [Pseudomonadota bacterium]